MTAFARIRTNASPLGFVVKSGDGAGCGRFCPEGAMKKRKNAPLAQLDRASAFYTDGCQLRTDEEKTAGGAGNRALHITRQLVAMRDLDEACAQQHGTGPRVAALIDAPEVASFTQVVGALAADRADGWVL